MYRLFLVLATIASPAMALSERDIVHFQPPITQTAPPAQLLNPALDIGHLTSRRGLNDYLPQVPAYNGRGNLLASWTPHKMGVKNRPTFIFVHGGHGITGLDAAAAMWARDELSANVLVLDSFWSRGRLENWLTFNEFGANMRALDSIAAGKFVLSQGVDPAIIYLMGGSQGGWTVLRTMTDNKFFNQYNRMFRAGVALYPVCITGGRHGRWYAPPLGPYNGIVVVFTAGRDTATPIDQCDRDIFTGSTLWKHYPGATHGFDVPFFNRPNTNIDGECTRALNIYNKFLVCRDDVATADMFNKVKTMVNMLSPYNN